jgi:hypothetical protein
MSADLRTLAEGAVCDVLEEFAFMLAEPQPAGQLPPLEGKPLCVRLSFRGSISGTIGMALPESLAETLATNTLGLDVDRARSETFAEDAIKELLTVLAGQLTACLGAPKESIQCSRPVRHSLDTAGWASSLGRTTTLGFQVEEHPLLVLLEIQERGALP